MNWFTLRSRGTCPGALVCSAVKPSLQVLRARFSEITARAVQAACENLMEPDRRVSDAVDVRQELDLRIGEGWGGGQGAGLGLRRWQLAVTLQCTASPCFPPSSLLRGCLHQVPDPAVAEDLS